MPVDDLDRFETQAFDEANKAADPETRLKWIQVANAIQDRRKSKADCEYAILNAQNIAADLKHQRTKFFVATLVPTVSTLIAVLALVFQGQQFNKSSEQEAIKFKQSTDFQTQQNTDSKWQESMKAVSFKDPQSALTGALSMQAFFGDKSYGSQSREIASSLLPLVNNVNGFEEVLEALYGTTAKDEDQIQIIAVAKALLMKAREQLKISGTEWSETNGLPKFLWYNIDSIDPNPEIKSGEREASDKVLAWEIDSASQRLSELWTEDRHLGTEYRPLAPNSLLTNVVLENAAFKGVHFKEKSDLSGSVLYDACLERATLIGVDLTNAVLRHVELRGADLSRIKHFDGSTWKDTDWWNARSMSAELKAHLTEHYPQKGTLPPPVASCN